MRPEEVVWFFNHKKGEKAYFMETKNVIQIFTPSSKWAIFKNDYTRFHRFSLYHYNDKRRRGYHKQMEGYELDYLVYCACYHDEPEFVSPKEWKEFQRLWEMYKLGREIEESVATWDFLCKD